MYRSKDLLSVLILFVLDQWERKQVCVCVMYARENHTDRGRKFRAFGIPFGGWGPVQCYLEPGAAVQQS